ncbi:uncharacterized protein LOC110817841 [Carica papaya]|uniref:uncharacterized protein LOC110817841 n=1 Tax=Carica papaya TaxID=3649 RepID=UPI000B8CD049|nr:uncharacterized protein LOC110817841 [Carica papaya]
MDSIRIKERILVMNPWNIIVQEPEVQPTASLSVMVSGYFEDGEPPLLPRSSSKNIISHGEEDDDEDEDKPSDSVEDEKSFWETQHQVLQETLRRSSSLESRIRTATKDALKEIQMSATSCSCRKSTVAAACRNCLMREVSTRLRNARYNCAVCKSKWRSSPDIPSGGHTFLDVVENSSGRRGEVRVIIELSFRAEFEMARASEEYNRLVDRLPEVFVGKVDRLKNVIKVLCLAAKKCMKEKKMHMGPWRKHRYMQAKWLSSTCERITSNTQVLGSSNGIISGERLPKPRASMLTVDLLDKLPNMHCTAVEVV